MSKFSLEFSKRLRQLRKEAGFTQKEFGEKLGLSESSVNKYEKGNIKDVGIDMAHKMATVLNTTPQVLMGWNTNEEDNQEEIETIAAHALKELNEEELEEVLNFARYIKSKNKGD